MQGHAFLLYGMSLKAATALREAMARTALPRVQAFNAKTDKLMEAHKPFYIDVSGHSYIAIKALHTSLERKGYRSHIYVKEAALPAGMLNEAWLSQFTTYGFLRDGLSRDLQVVRSGRRLIEAVTAALKPKEPSDVDRLKVTQKKQELMLKTQQNNDLLQAQERELEKKAREQQQKLQEPKKSGKA